MDIGLWACYRLQPPPGQTPSWVYTWRVAYMRHRQTLFPVLGLQAYCSNLTTPHARVTTPLLCGDR